MTSAFGTNRISGLRGNALDVAFVGNTSPNFMDGESWSSVLETWIVSPV